MNDKHFSVEHEPALAGGGFRPDPAEDRAAPCDRPPDESEALRDSVACEPALPEHADPEAWSCWLEQKRRRCSLPGNLAATLLAAVLGGPFAVLGALMAGFGGTGRVLYVIVFAPVVEELLKQSGMTLLLEKKPYRVFAAWQFVLAALVSGLVFATIENVAAVSPWGGGQAAEDVARLAAYRWTVCTTLHVVCAVIASLGLVRVWRRQLQDGRPANLAAAVPFFTAAIVLHGLYNLAALLAGPRF